MTVKNDYADNIRDAVNASWLNEVADASNAVTNGTLTSSLISDFDTAVASNSAVASNTAKVGVTTEISNVVEDTTPELGGNLDCLDNNLLNIKSADFNIYANGSSGASITINLDNGGFQSLTISETTSITISATNITRCTLFVSGGASFASSWTGVTWLTTSGTAPTLDGTDVITFIYDGTTIYGAISNQS